MEVTFKFRWQGGQQRPYGPRVFDFTIKVEHNTEYSRTAFDNWARWVVPGFRPQTSAEWWEWRLTHVDKIGRNHWHYIIEQPYDD